MSIEKSAQLGDLVLVARLHSCDSLTEGHVVYRTFILGVAEQVNCRGRVLSILDYQGPQLIQMDRDVIHVASWDEFSKTPTAIVLEVGRMVGAAESFADARAFVAPYLKRRIAA